MVSPILSVEPWKLVEHLNGRHPYVQYKDEKFVKSLFYVAKKLIDAPVISARHKELYIDAIEAINAHYFAAYDLNETTEGQFHKYDASAEEHLRETVAEEVSRCVTDLRALIDAHATVVEAATTRLATQHRDSDTQQERSATFERTIATCTIRAVRDGWFPTVESYYFCLHPGERAAEGRERREQRLYGTEETQGVATLLAQPDLDQVTTHDITRLKQIDTHSQVNGHPVILKLQTQYDWTIRG